eukprot:TRINITY_DN3698_c0_g1_i5.p1 TRINITY_DN3698_c0_g1~~TRINITY_DN3698_c0_g1_i5.p1  ORF type:complete len:361 (+),score=64.58 TRINITY_DN3698_c0_g1_i5:84-1166(+)
MSKFKRKHTLLYLQPHSDGCEKDRILCVFVARFDTKGGNIIEWQHPKDLDLGNIEFKAMPSGLHKLEQDFVYFKIGEKYGLACFHRRKLEEPNNERGARMKSVGVLMHSYSSLYFHQDFLQKEAVIQTSFPIGEAHYGSLTDYFAKHQTLTVSTGGLVATHPVGSFYHFVEYFAEKIMMLWKAAVLGYRILFFTVPPIGFASYTVYDACCLPLHSSTNCKHIHPNPMFYVNVADIDYLEGQANYIAATTENIFAGKTRLYDIYVDQRNVIIQDPVVLEACKLTPGDQERLRNFKGLREQVSLNRRGQSNTSASDDQSLKESVRKISTFMCLIFLDSKKRFNRSEQGILCLFLWRAHFQPY